MSFEPEGVVLTIRRSKTDCEGAVATVAVPLGGEEATCPVGALRRWLAAAAVSEGHVFRRIDRHGNLGPTLSDRRWAEIVAGRAAAASLEGDFAGRGSIYVSITASGLIAARAGTPCRTCRTARGIGSPGDTGGFFARAHAQNAIRVAL
jgi:hypothetical protein